MFARAISALQKYIIDEQKVDLIVEMMTKQKILSQSRY
jgi:hypothetical protein